MKRSIISAVLALLGVGVLLAQGVSAQPDARQTLAALDTDTQALKRAVLALNRELFVLEEELLYPSNTQLSVFVSLDVGEYFELDSVELTLNGSKVSNYLYTERELAALQRGGVHQLFIGNVKTGPHELVAVFTGKGTHERDYRRAATLNFDKDIGAKYVELRISDRVQKLQPEFVVRQWE